MNKPLSIQLDAVDPRTIDPDKGVVESVAADASAALSDRQYHKMRCYHALNKEFVGYLSTRGNQTVAVGTGDDYPAAEVYWVEKNGALYLAKQTDPYDRCLGLGDGGYACWALQQSGNSGYFINVIRNADGTISPGPYPQLYLAGPYRTVGIDWVWWAQKGDPDILTCDLEEAGI